MDYKKEIKALYPEVVEIRRDIHMHAETGFKEFRTAKLIRDYLGKLNIDEIHECAGTGTIGVLKGGKPGKTAMIRMDIDALPMDEDNDLPFKSINKGAAHCCGHDGHTAMLLGMAKIFAEHRDEIPGNIVFLFQPNEEDAGAQIMIDEGAIEMAGHPDAAFGGHIYPDYPLGAFGVASGPFEASSYYYKITIHGKGGHGGIPWDAINPLDAVVPILTGINLFNALEQSVFEPTVITNCMIHGGDKEITVAETAEMQGSIRCLHLNHEKVHNRFKEIVENACKSVRCTCDIELKCGNSLVYNDPEMAAEAKRIATEISGADKVITEGLCSMGGDDYAEFLQYMPGMYTYFGCGGPAEGETYGIHHPKYMMNEEVLPYAMEFTMKSVMNWLKKHQ